MTTLVFSMLTVHSMSRFWILFLEFLKCSILMLQLVQKTPFCIVPNIFLYWSEHAFRQKNWGFRWGRSSRPRWFVEKTKKEKRKKKKKRNRKGWEQRLTEARWDCEEVRDNYWIWCFSVWKTHVLAVDNSHYSKFFLLGFILLEEWKCGRIFPCMCLVGGMEKWEGEKLFYLVKKMYEDRKYSLYKLTLMPLLHNR